MQNLYLKIKDKWWAVIMVFPILALLLTKIFDKIFANLEIFENIKGFLKNIIIFLNYRIEVSVLSFIVGFWVVYKYFSYIKAKIQEQIKSGQVKIISAKYGYGKIFLDITNELNNYIKEQKLPIIVSNKIKGDPCIGQQKICIIDYEYINKRYTRTYIEGETLDLLDFVTRTL